MFARDLEVDGALSPRVVNQALRRYALQVEHCYEQQLIHEPGLNGKVEVRFVIGASGSVSEAIIAASTLGNPGVEACITRAARRWTFPAPQDGGVVRITYPVELSTPTLPPPAPAGTIGWTLRFSPSRVTMARRGEVDIHISATNRGRVTVNPGRNFDFTIDGASSMTLNHVFNGGMERAWTALPPGQTVHDRREDIEVADTPGTHVIVMSTWDGTELARATLRITP